MRSPRGEKGRGGALNSFKGQACPLTHVNERVCAGVQAEFTQDLCDPVKIDNEDSV